MDKTELETVIKQIRDTVVTPQKMFINYIRPVMRSGEISPLYPFEGDGESDRVFALAHERTQELLAKPVEHIDEATTRCLYEGNPRPIAPTERLPGRKLA